MDWAGLLQAASVTCGLAARAYGTLSTDRDAAERLRTAEIWNNVSRSFLKGRCAIRQRRYRSAVRMIGNLCKHTDDLQDAAGYDKDLSRARTNLGVMLRTAECSQDLQHSR